VVAFFMDKRIILRKKYYGSVGVGAGSRGLINPLSFIAISYTRSSVCNYSVRRNMSTRNYGIIGGGLAGLSTAYHLLEKSPSANITIFDLFDSGNGGASSVAGGLLHPLSPKGKLAYKGFEGLASANKLIQAASQFENNVVLRKKIYRIAMTEANVVQYQKTAGELPELATWIEPGSTTSTGSDDDKEDWEGKYFSSEKNVLGALRLSGNCKVLHMKSYLKGLWSYCQSTGTGNKKWITHDDDDSTSIDSSKWKERLAEFDCVVWCAGSGLFQSSFMDQDDFPITLVRGQSIEMTMNDDAARNAVLCGKYVSPMLGNDRVLIGATHEYKEEPLKPSEVEAELKERSYDFASEIWDNGTVEKVTSGYRVQSNRGHLGRLPIVGKLNNHYHHHNSWIFTGLSGRGILYHGIYGDLLSNLILGKINEDSDHLKNMDWWRK